jgi:hypothetical protein
MMKLQTGQFHDVYEVRRTDTEVLKWHQTHSPCAVVQLSVGFISWHAFKRILETASSGQGRQNSAKFPRTAIVMFLHYILHHRLVGLPDRCSFLWMLLKPIDELEYNPLLVTPTVCGTETFVVLWGHSELGKEAWQNPSLNSSAIQISNIGPCSQCLLP